MDQTPVDPARCPDCAELHGGGASCAHCGLRLLGPEAVELWYVSKSIEQMAARRAALLTALRNQPAAPATGAETIGPPEVQWASPPAAFASQPAGRHVRGYPARPSAAPVSSAGPAPTPAWHREPPRTGGTGPGAGGSGAGSGARVPGTGGSGAAGPGNPYAGAVRPRPEWSQRRVQNMLLGLGVLLLAIAALIFTVVTWGTMGVVGRAAILLLVTAAVAAAAPAFNARGLDATAEALAALAIALLVIDAQGARQSVPSLSRLDARVYWAVATALIAALCAAYAARVQLETPRLAAVVASQLPGLLVAMRMADAAGSAAVLLAQTCVTAYVATRWQRRQIVQCLVVAATLTGVAGAVLAFVAAFDATELEPAIRGAAALVAAAASCIWIGLLLRRTAGAPRIASSAATVAATCAVLAVSRHLLDESSLAATAALCGLGAVAIGLALERTWGEGPTTVGATVAALAVLAEIESWLGAAAWPVSWLNESWTTDDPAAAARVLLSPEWRWPGQPAALVTLVAAAAAAAMCARGFRSRLIWSAAFAPALAGIVVVAPLALNASYAAAIGWELAVVVALTVAAIRAEPHRPAESRLVAAAAAVLLVGHAVPWALATEITTHAALAVAAVVAGVAAALRPAFRSVATAICTSALLCWVFAITRTAGASLHVCAFVLSLAGAVLLAATAVNARRELTSRVDARVVEVIAAGAYVFIVSLTFYEPPWAGGSLLAGALAAAAVATRPDRMFAAAAASGLAAASAWAGVIALGKSPEAAGLTVAIVACLGAGAGWLLRHRRGELVEITAAVTYAVGVIAALPSDPLLACALAAGGITCFALSARSDRVQLAAVATALAAACAWATAIASGGSTAEAGLAVAVTGCVGAGIGWALQRRAGHFVEAVAATAYAVGLAAATADTTMLAFALAAGSATCFAVSIRGDRLPLAAVGTLLAASCAGAAAIAIGASDAGAGLAAALTGCAGAGLGWLLQRRRGELVEIVAATAYAVGLSFTLDDLALLSLALPAGGLTCFAISVRRDRRAVAYAGWALLTLLLWRRLAEADVTAPEPYLLPPALLTLALGYLRRRNNPSMNSWIAYGTGLTLALEPTLYMTLSDPALTRPMLLGAGAFIVVLAGARARLQAPLLLGSATLAIDAIVQVAPLAGSLPRWVGLAVVGSALVFIGATYEHRLRNLRALQEHIEALG